MQRLRCCRKFLTALSLPGSGMHRSVVKMTLVHEAGAGQKLRMIKVQDNQRWRPTEPAGILNYAQSTVSKIIADLESEWKMSLLEHQPFMR